MTMKEYLKNLSASAWAVIGVVVIVLLMSSLYTVKETERALVSILGRLVEDQEGHAKIIGPGLHMKVPFISDVIKLDSRIQNLDISEARIMTKEQKDVLVNSFVKWKISNFGQFYKATAGGIFMNAESLLEQKVADGLRASFGVSSIAQVVSENRDVIMRDLSTQIDASAQSLGIEVVDVRIKRIDLPDEVSVSVFQRMRADRQRVAARHRADGEQKGEEVRAKADEESVIVVATAQKESRMLRGQADANVSRLYGQAYSKDSDFYAFMRSLQAYENVFNGKNDMFVVSPDGEFFEFFKSDKAR